MYIAHINDKDNTFQSVKEHCCATAELAKEFSVEQLKDTVYAMGLLHDIGKYQPSFQRKIKSGVNLKVEHSTCGAVCAKEKYNSPLSLIMQYCIAGHHSGIPNGGALNDTADMSTLCARMRRKCEDYSAYKDEITLPNIDEQVFNEFLLKDCCDKIDILIDKFAFLTRYCFSCLTDADSIDTASFCSGVQNREMISDFSKCLDKINKRLSSFKRETDLQKARSVIQKQVYDKVDVNSEIYLMNMPTGSGKTLCSMKFALERAIKYGKKRIIYVIAYNSIIDQTAQLFEELFSQDA